MQLYLNGKFVAEQAALISVFDRGFIFGDSVYEVVPVFAGRAFRLVEHLERLERSLAGVGIPNPYPRAHWQALIEELVARNDGGELSVYVQVSRGLASASTLRDLVPAGPLEPTVLIVPVRRQRVAPAAVHAVTVEDNRWLRCDLKVTSLLPNVLLRREAIERGGQDAILVRNGLVSEGSASNVFVCRDGAVSTPARSALLLHGITRDLVVRLLGEHGMPVRECDLPVAELHAADEIWLTGSIREIVPVTRLDGRPVGAGEPGPLWRRAFEIYAQFRDSVR